MQATFSGKICYTKGMKLTANMEDYLEAVAFCADENGMARVSDIRDMLGVKTPSVTGAMKALAQDGYVVHARYSGITLTAKGRRAAQDVKSRHELFRHFLADVLGVNPKTAEEDACKMEHTVSRETLAKLQAYVNKISTK